MKRQILAIAAVFCLLTAWPVSAQDEVRMTVTPQVIEIDAFYNGARLIATGTAPADSDVVFRLMGQSCDLNMKERGKVLGIMWMNLDSLIFRGVPSVCIVGSALDLESLSPKAGQGGPAIKTLRLSGIKDLARIEGNGIDREVAFGELIKLKQNEGLYCEKVCDISYGPSEGGLKTFRVEIPVPSRLSPGAYMVELAAVRNGVIVARAQQPVTADLVGFPALLSGLAFRHAALYGILATLVAIVVGLGVGLVFQSKGAH